LGEGFQRSPDFVRITPCRVEQYGNSPFFGANARSATLEADHVDGGFHINEGNDRRIITPFPGQQSPHFF
jgi:hypothetical protein